MSAEAPAVQEMQTAMPPKAAEEEQPPLIDCHALAMGNKKRFPAYAAFILIASVAWAASFLIAVMPKLKTSEDDGACGKVPWVPGIGIAMCCACIFAVLARGLFFVPVVAARHAAVRYPNFANFRGSASSCCHCGYHSDGPEWMCLMRFLFDGVVAIIGFWLVAFGAMALFELNNQDRRCEHHPYAYWALAGAVLGLLFPIGVIWQNYIIREAVCEAASSEQERSESQGGAV